jgi:hypothetical protein
MDMPAHSEFCRLEILPAALLKLSKDDAGKNGNKYHREILMDIGDLIGREIEYSDEVDPPYMRFVDFEG